MKKRLKKLISTMVVTSILLTLFPATVHAAEEKVGVIFTDGQEISLTVAEPYLKEKEAKADGNLDGIEFTAKFIADENKLIIHNLKDVRSINGLNTEKPFVIELNGRNEVSGDITSSNDLVITSGSKGALVMDSAQDEILFSLKDTIIMGDAAVTIQTEREMDGPGKIVTGISARKNIRVLGNATAKIKIETFSNRYSADQTIGMRADDGDIEINTKGNVAVAVSGAALAVGLKATGKIAFKEAKVIRVEYNGAGSKALEEDKLELDESDWQIKNKNGSQWREWEYQPLVIDTKRVEIPESVANEAIQEVALSKVIVSSPNAKPFYQFRKFDPLPQWLRLNEATGVLSGTPVEVAGETKAIFEIVGTNKAFEIKVGAVRPKAPEVSFVHVFEGGHDWVKLTGWDDDTFAKFGSEWVKVSAANEKIPMQDVKGKSLSFKQTVNAIDSKEQVVNFPQNDKPSGLTKIDSTSETANNGKILGVNSEMEYKNAESRGAWIKVQGLEITGLAAGTYYVRNAFTASNRPLLPSDAVEVEIAAKPVLSGMVEIKGMAKENEILTADTSKVSSRNADGSEPVYQYEWYRGENKIAGATAKTYGVSKADINHKLKVKVLAAGFENALESDWTETVVKAAEQPAPQNPQSPSVPQNPNRPSVPNAPSRPNAPIASPSPKVEEKKMEEKKADTQKSDTEKMSEDKTAAFQDVAKDVWYQKAVSYVTEKGLMRGVSENSFAPQVSASRGMVVTILHRLAGQPKVSGMGFADVAETHYSADAVKWAVSKEIAGGYGNGNFGPDDALTREQLALLLRNYAKNIGKDVSKQADLSEFVDNRSVSGYAKEAVAWGYSLGLVKGKDGKALDPKGMTTRAELAEVLMRFVENVLK